MVMLPCSTHRSSLRTQESKLKKNVDVQRAAASYLLRRPKNGVCTVAAVLCCVMQWYVAVCSGMQWYAVLCSVMQCYGVFCHVLHLYEVLCSVMQCSVVVATL
jgi:hypothetical protein